MKGFKKIVALGIVATMVMGSSLTAFASESTTREITTSDGTVTAAEQTVAGEATENYINKKVFKIVAPTTAWEADVFDFITDPQGLIVETEAAAIGTVDIVDDTGVFFKNKDENGTVVAISSTSDPLTLINKSTSGVKMAVTVQLKEASTDKYAKGYSSTVDFTGSGDDAKGLYLGLTSTGNPVTPLDETAQSLSSYAKSAYELFTVGYASNAYTFDIPADYVDYAPVYSFTINGALNKALADTTWYKVTDGKPLTVGAALSMPDIELKYTPTYIDARQCHAAFGETGIEMYNYDDTGFASEAEVTAGSIKVNGKAVGDVAKCTEDGVLVIPYDKIYTALGVASGTDEEKEAALGLIQGVEATVGGIAMYANIG
jgi:hypothetical protein